MQDIYRKAGRLLLGLFVLHILLVTSHMGDMLWSKPTRHELGEFWPFSIYPMFSRGAHPWVRSLVREMPSTDDPNLWHTSTLENLPGEVYALDDRGILQNDISNFISKSETWNARRVAGLRRVFGEDLATKNLMILRADGSIEGDSVIVVFTPFLFMTPDSTYFNPNLEYNTD